MNVLNRRFGQRRLGPRRLIVTDAAIMADIVWLIVVVMSMRMRMTVSVAVRMRMPVRMRFRFALRLRVVTHRMGVPQHRGRQGTARQNGDQQHGHNSAEYRHHRSSTSNPSMGRDTRLRFLDERKCTRSIGRSHLIARSFLLHINHAGDRPIRSIELGQNQRSSRTRRIIEHGGTSLCVPCLFFQGLK